MELSNTLHFTKPAILLKIEAINKGRYLKHDSGQSVSAGSLEVKESIRDYYAGLFSYTTQKTNGHPTSLADISSKDQAHLTDFISSGRSLLNNNYGITISIHANYTVPLTHDHSFFEIICVINGKCMNCSGDQTLELTAGDILILAPGTKHSISVFDDDSFIMNILINPTVFEQTFFHVFSDHSILKVFFSNVLYHFTTDSFILFHTVSDPVIMSALYQLNLLTNHYHYYYEQLKISSVSLLFTRLIAYHEKDAIIYSETFTGVNQNISLILRYIQQHFTTITLKELSDFFGYSERQMLRILKSYTNKSFKEIIRYLRIHYAAKLLSESNKTIDEISSICGYSSARALRKLFNEEFNISPSDYRKKQFIIHKYRQGHNRSCCALVLYYNFNLLL